MIYYDCNVHGENVMVCYGYPVDLRFFSQNVTGGGPKTGVPLNHLF